VVLFEKKIPKGYQWRRGLAQRIGAVCRNGIGWREAWHRADSLTPLLAFRYGIF